MGLYLNPQIPLLSISGLHSITNQVTSLIGVLLGFYISTVVSRWWSLRNSTLGALWGAVDICACCWGHTSLASSGGQCGPWYSATAWQVTSSPSCRLKETTRSFGGS